MGRPTGGGRLSWLAVLATLLATSGTSAALEPEHLDTGRRTRELTDADQEADDGGADDVGGAAVALKRVVALPAPAHMLTMLNLLLGFVTSYLIGANDAANSWATTMGTGVMSWNVARIFACAFEMFGGMTSKAVSKKIIDNANPEGKFSFHDGYGKKMDDWPTGVVASQAGSAAWQGLVTMLGIPSSGTHSVVGGVVGMATYHDFLHGPKWDKFGKLVIGWFLSPVAAALMAHVLLLACLAFSRVGSADLRGSMFYCFRSNVVFPLFAVGFISAMTCLVEVLEDKFETGTFFWVRLAVGVCGVLVSAVLPLVCRGRKRRSILGGVFGCCRPERDDRPPVLGPTIFAFVSMWMMLSSSATLVLLKNENVADMIGFTKKDLFKTKHFAVLSVCAALAAGAAFWVYRQLRAAGRSDKWVSEEAAAKEMMAAGVSRKGKMSAGLAGYLGRDASWVGALRHQGATWQPVEAATEPGTKRGPFSAIFTALTSALGLSRLTRLLGGGKQADEAPKKKAHRAKRVVNYKPSAGSKMLKGYAANGTLVFDGVGYRWATPMVPAAKVVGEGHRNSAPVFDDLKPCRVRGSGGFSGGSLVVNLSWAEGATETPPIVGHKLVLGPELSATCIGEAGDGVFWFDLSRPVAAPDADKISAVAPQLFEAECGATTTSCQLWDTEAVGDDDLRLVGATSNGPGADDGLTLKEYTNSARASRAVHDAFKWLLVVCACLQSFVHGANDTPNAAAAMTAFKDYTVAASGRNTSVYSAGAVQGGMTTSELFTVCLMVAAGVFTGGHNVIGSLTDVMGPELRGSHLVAYCIEVAAQMSAAVFTILEMPISTTHCEVGALCLIAFLVNGKLNKEKVVGVVFALLTAATMSGVLARLAMQVMVPMFQQA